MNLYKGIVEVYYASEPGKSCQTLADLLDNMTGTNTVIKDIVDTGEGVPEEHRIVDDCPAGDWTCPYWYEGGCTLENCREECDAWDGWESIK